MEGLIWLLVFAGFIYFMVRFGCGAHMAHGGHGENRNEGQDPVCGMPIEANKGYTKAHAGASYWFCSKVCLEKFEANPEEYLGSTMKKGMP